MQISIIGTGEMAKALIKGMHKTYDIEIVGRDKTKLQNLKDKYSSCKITSLDEFNSHEKNIILCIKPYALKDISIYFREKAKLLISILANTTLEELKQNIDSNYYLRAMPNTAVKHQRSITPLYGDIKIKDEAISIFNTVGKSLWLDSQKELDIATRLSGCGPAYLALVAEALCDGATKSGLKRDDALILTKGLFDSFSQLLDHEDNPSNIKNAIMSPGGVTAKGYAKLEKNRVRYAFMEVVEE